MRNMNRLRRTLRPAALLAALSLVASGCGLDEVQEPALDGPSELGVSLKLTVSPDILLANGFSTSLVQAVLRGPNGEPVANREVIFTVADAAGRTADIGTFVSTASARDLGTSVSVRTNGQGVAQTVYEAPSRMDATANMRVTISARPLGDDAYAAVYRSVAIELRSPEPRLFPQNPNNVAPKCNFITQAPNGFRAGATILFQSTAFDEDGTIVRYEWFFTDGTIDDAPDIAHVFRSAGTWSVTHLVTDNNGGQDACTASITVN